MKSSEIEDVNMKKYFTFLEFDVAMSFSLLQYP